MPLGKPKNTGTKVTQQDATNGAQTRETRKSGQTQAQNSAILKSDQMSNNSSKFKQKTINRYLARQSKRNTRAQEDALFNDYITWEEDEITALAKWDVTAPRFLAIEKAHKGHQQQNNESGTKIQRPGIQ